MNHSFENYVIVRENYFNDPDLIVDLSKTQAYKRGTIYPGMRTGNLLESQDFETRTFARHFAERLSFDVFPTISNFTISVYFHQNEVYENEILNKGWIHNDDSLLAGLVYLNKDEEDFCTGTSFFNEIGKENPEDEKARKEFNLNLEVSNQYILSLKNNWNQFTETVKVGNKYNRLLAYDAKMFHRPNNYKLKSNNPRLTLLFFISKFDYIKHEWSNKY
jgi:hypothetical protein